MDVETFLKETRESVANRITKTPGFGCGKGANDCLGSI